MKTAKELRERRDALLAEGKTLLETLEQDGHVVTAEEETRMAGIKTELDEIKGKLEQLDRVDAFRSGIRAESEYRVPETQQESRRQDRPEGVTHVETVEREREKGEQVGTIVRAVALFGRDKRAALDWAEQQYGGRSPEYRALEGSTFTAGGALVQESYAREVIELLRARSVIRKLSPVVVQLVNGNFTMPKLTGGARATYVGEAKQITKTQETVGQLKLSEKKLAALVPVSNDLLMNASPDASLLVRDDLIAAMATKEDAAFLRDDGTEFTPKGIRHWAVAANVSASNGTTLAQVRQDIRELIQALQGANVRMLRPAWIMAPRAKNFMMWDLVTANDTLPFHDELAQGRLNGWPVGVTNNVPTNLGAGTDSELYLVDMADVVIGDAMTLQIALSQEASYTDGSNTRHAFERDETVVRAISKHDIGMRHDESIAVKTGLGYGA